MAGRGRKMKAVYMKVVTGGSVAKPNFVGGPNTLTLNEQ